MLFIVLILYKNNKFMDLYYIYKKKTYRATSLSDTCNLNHVQTCFHSFFNYHVTTLVLLSV